jgi:hypothetical protein
MTMNTLNPRHFSPISFLLSAAMSEVSDRSPVSKGGTTPPPQGPSAARAPTNGWMRRHRAASLRGLTSLACHNGEQRLPDHASTVSRSHTTVMIHNRQWRSPTTLVLSDKVVGGGSTRVRACVSKVTYYPCGTCLEPRTIVGLHRAHDGGGSTSTRTVERIHVRGGGHAGPVRVDGDGRR